jgi:hypothetical protein
MKTNIKKDKYEELGALLAEADIAETVCEKALVQIKQAKRELVQKFGGQLAGHESVLRLALNEAEALAWDTHYPHLVFATLAMEKAQAAATWETRQQLLSSRPLNSPGSTEAKALNHV